MFELCYGMYLTNLHFFLPDDAVQLPFGMMVNDELPCRRFGTYFTMWPLDDIGLAIRIFQAVTCQSMSSSVGGWVSES